MTDEQEVQQSIPDAAPAPSPAPAPSETPLHWTHEDAENDLNTSLKMRPPIDTSSSTRT